MTDCEQRPTTSATPAAPMPPAAASPSTSPSAPAKPIYAGTYTVQDTAVCALSITIGKQADGYSFTTGTTQGQVQVEQQDSSTYFTFAGLKGADPVDDVEAVWQDSMLVIQNTGNSMNPYTRFEQCDAKYLELVRQR
ncbi:hypothetical protein [Hymenobacter norwichensis]|uniref:hypothetical protein n=1 Tax=Hymenobacter norwichensis TaxID=223903 RepID=UPI0012FB824C|nr:hypothetical protein [Hymenobacter norwichensis]